MPHYCTTAGTLPRKVLLLSIKVYIYFVYYISFLLFLFFLILFCFILGGMRVVTALNYIYRRNYVHMDVKPSNIMVDILAIGSLVLLTIY